ncbi:hypothetical protein V4W22_21075 [Pseudomonas aeruginosa]
MNEILFVPVPVHDFLAAYTAVNISEAKARELINFLAAYTAVNFLRRSMSVAVFFLAAYTAVN